MKTVYSEDHRLHHASAELNDGEMMPCFEKPARADQVLAEVERAELGPIIPPDDHGEAPIRRVHTDQYIDFFQSAWSRWADLGRSNDMLPLAWPPRRVQPRCPQDIDGQLGYFSFDAGAPITATTWQAVYSGAQVALSAAALLQHERQAFALCRPPGHHAGADYMGGYCYLNNAAIAAQSLLDQGARRVALLDVDYHHGNGTQDIFWTRPDVLVASIHADPRVEYPFFAGHADERGVGTGEGFNHNYPLPPGTAWAAWSQALQDALRVVAGYAPDALVISLGVDTFSGDPISQFRLQGDDYLRMGEQIGALRLPTLFVMEGGYAVAEIGLNAVNVLRGAATQKG
ncbi:histone deacetylase family protein [Natronospirillum operosum]|uniref:Histone deacetylase family protein n=1 Tax=Natronospirillum operosum TaxID=2759953 RepID=A0A4Z0WFY0_9GAMM|nr:histone deacetylase family protein [Natronospirillum operosum]TGG94071.1 histone deacetylase family protein [Natronospirillum operosum]